MNNNGIKATIEKLTDTKVFLRIHGELKSLPRQLIDESKKIGEEIIIKLEDPKHIKEETEAHYQAMKKLLKEIVQ